MTSMPDRAAVVELFGEVDDLVVTRILGTGATRKELAEAFARLTAEDGRSVLRGPPTQRVLDVMQVVGERWGEEAEEELEA